MVKHVDVTASPLAPAAETRRGPAHAPARLGAERPFDFAKTLELVRRRSMLVVACILIGGAASFLAGYALGPTFTATALLAVAEVDDSPSGRGGAESAVDTQIAMLQSPVFMERVFKALSHDAALRDFVPSLTDLERRLKVMQELKSRLVGIYFSAKSPAVAADVANTIARLYVQDTVLQGVQSVDDADSQYVQRSQALEAELQSLLAASGAPDATGAASADPTLAAKVADLRDRISTLKLDQTLARRRQESRSQMMAMTPPVQLVAMATPPTRRSSVNPLIITAPGILFSALFGFAAAVLLGRLDTRIYGETDLDDLAGAVCAGSVPARRIRVWRGEKTAGAHPGYRRAIEAIVTQTLLLPSARRQILLVTSSESADSDPDFAREVATVASRIADKVLLVDLDIARPARRASMVARALSWGKPVTRPDVLDVLSDRCGAADAIQRMPDGDLFVLPLMNNWQDDCFALIAGGRLSSLFDEIRHDYDWIIVAGPPMIGVHETQIIATLADSAILTVKSGVSRLPTVHQALESLENVLSMGGRSSAYGLSTALVDTPEPNSPASLLARGAPQRWLGKLNPNAAPSKPSIDIAAAPSADHAHAISPGEAPP